MSSPEIEKTVRKRNCGLFLSNSPAFPVQKSSKVLMQSLRATKRAKTFRSCCARISHVNMDFVCSRAVDDSYRRLRVVGFSALIVRGTIPQADAAAHVSPVLLSHSLNVCQRLFQMGIRSSSSDFTSHFNQMLNGPSDERTAMATVTSI